MPQIRELKIFYFEALAAVEKEGSFTAAAKALGVSKSLVSKALTEYEELLGYKLFERNTRNVKITPAGAQLVVSVRTLLRFCHERHDSAEAIARAVKQGREGSTVEDLQEHLRDLERVA